MTIREFRKSDESQVLAVWYAAAISAHHFMPPEHFESERLAIASTYLPMAQTWVFEHAGGVVGFISMIGNAIGGLFVEPAMQGKGIGTALVDYVFQQHDSLEVEVFEQNGNGLRFYKNYGFVPCDKSQYGGGGQWLLHLQLRK